MRLALTAGVALAAALTLGAGHATAQSCEDDGNRLLADFAATKDTLAAKGCSALDPFISARTSFADFIDAAPGRGCSQMYVAMNRLLLSLTYKKPPAKCDWQAKGDNRQLQYDAIAVINRDLAGGVFLDGDAVVLKQEFWHAGNHDVTLGVQTCRRSGADAAFAMACAEGREASQSSAYTFDITQIDTNIDVMQQSALAVFTLNSAQTPEDLVKSLTRRGSTSDATRVVLHCLPDTQCVRIADGVMLNLVQLYCDPDTSCNDVLSHVADVLAMLRRPPH